MNLVSRALLVTAAFLAWGALARAVEHLPGGYLKTGDAVRVKKVGPMSVDVYSITHSMKQLPSPLTKPSVIDAEVDKKFDWVMLRNVDGKRLQDTMREAFKKNGYNDSQKIEQFVAPLGNGLSEDARVQIYYDAPSKSTTMSTPNGRASVTGDDFMKATWRIWFGNIDQANIGKELLDDAAK